MPTTFDPDAGLLRIRHAALAVLARLATTPNDTRLHDHDVAPLVAELRGAGLLGRSGIHADVAPMAAAIGEAQTVGDLSANDHSRALRTRLWLGSELVVVGVASEDDPHTYELMADRRAAAPSLVAELVGLGAAPEPPVADERILASDDLDRLLAADTRVSQTEVADALGAAAGDPWAQALADGLRGAALRWRLTTWQGEVALADIEVLDAGRSGLWLAQRAGPRARVRATTREAVNQLLAVLTTGGG